MPLVLHIYRKKNALPDSVIKRMGFAGSNQLTVLLSLFKLFALKSKLMKPTKKIAKLLAINGQHSFFVCPISKQGEHFASVVST